MINWKQAKWECKRQVYNYYAPSPEYSSYYIDELPTGFFITMQGPEEDEPKKQAGPFPTLEAAKAAYVVLGYHSAVT